MLYNNILCFVEYFSDDEESTLNAKETKGDSDRCYGDEEMMTDATELPDT